MIVAAHSKKTISWHGKAEETENVYHFITPIDGADVGSLEALATALVNAEKTVFGSNVTFKQVRIHGPTNTTPADDKMIAVKDMTGVGSQAPGSYLPPELSMVASFYVGRSSRGYKRFLRKFLHLGILPGGAGNASMANGELALPSTAKTPVVNFMNSVKNLSTGLATYNICTPDGTGLPVGSAPTVLDYTYTRQFRAGRRRKPATPPVV